MFLNHVVKYPSLGSPGPIAGHLLYIGLVPMTIEGRKIWTLGFEYDFKYRGRKQERIG